MARNFFNVLPLDSNLDENNLDWVSHLCHLRCRGASAIRQVREEATGPYRHISTGAWPFSTRDHGWPISDCTSEGVKVRTSSYLHLSAAKHLSAEWMLITWDGT